MQNKSTASELIDQAFAAHRSGDIGSAKAFCENALQMAPDYPDALHLLGLITAGENDAEAALDLIERAIAIEPNEPMFRLNIAALYGKQKNASRVVDHLRAAAKLAPQEAKIRMRLAAAELKLGQFEEAAETFEVAHRLEPHNANTLIGAVKAKLLAGALDDAFSTAMIAREKWPANVAVLKLVCGVSIRVRKWRVLYETAAVWRRIDPLEMDAHRCLASAYAELLDAKKARDAFKPLIEADSASPSDWVAYARYCLLAFDYEEAGRALDKAQTLAPDLADLKYAQSRYYLFLGDLEKSEQYCRAAIKLDPENPLAYAHLAVLKKGHLDDELLAVMQGMADDDHHSLDHRSTLYLSVGAALHGHQNFPAAMVAFDRGNGLSQELMRIEAIQYDRKKAEEARRRDVGFFTLHTAPDKDVSGPATPIFIIGAPRSGTTLLESILAAHPQVSGAGELAALPLIHDAALAVADQTGVKCFQDIPEAQLSIWREEYFSAWPAQEGARYVVDKQPMNIRSVGLIKALFPEAVLFHIRRNPVETCFSIYRHDFSKSWPFASSLSDTGHYYGEYARFMAHWHDVMKQDLLLIQYEALIENFEAQARNIIAHCKLEWSDACLTFYENKRPIRTFSSAQVRSPINQNTQWASDQYGEMLAPLAKALRDAGVDLVNGSYLGQG